MACLTHYQLQNENIDRLNNIAILPMVKSAKSYESMGCASERNPNFEEHNRTLSANGRLQAKILETGKQTITSMTSLSQQTSMKSRKKGDQMLNINYVKGLPRIDGNKCRRLVFLSDLLDQPIKQPIGKREDYRNKPSDNNTWKNDSKRRPKTAAVGERVKVHLPPRPKTASTSGSPSNKERTDNFNELCALRGAKYSTDSLNRSVISLTNKIKEESINRRLSKQNSEEKVRKSKDDIKFKTSLPPEQKVAWLHLKREREAAIIEGRKARKQRLQRLYWTAQWKVLWIIRWQKIMAKHSMEITPKTAKEMQYHQLNNSEEARDLAFNKSLYHRDRIFTRLAPWAITILTKDPQERNESDCRRIHALLRGLKSFDKFTERIQLAMCQSFHYQYVHSDRMILRKGHVGFNFYFIFSGSVFVDIEESDSKGNTFLQTEATLHRGSSFGELALLKDIKRQANIRCREPCELLVVEKEVFSNVCPRIFDKELEEKVDFISNLPLFQTRWWTDDALQSICFEAQIQEYKTGKIIVTDSATDDWIYICMEGQCTIYKHLELENELVPNYDRRRSTFSRDVTVESHEDSTKDARAQRLLNEPKVKEDKEKHKVDKTRLLNSMALEWMQVHEKLSEVVDRHEEEDAVKTAKRSIEDNEQKVKVEAVETPCGVTSFTSFITEKMALADNRELVFLSIGTLEPLQVFDLYAIVRQKVIGSASLILVSSGAKLLRIKRTRFAGCAAPEAMKHAQMVSNKDEYKTDGELLYSYDLKNKWDGFKQTVVNQVIEPHIEQARRRYLANYLDGKQADKKRQAQKLMSVLRKNGRQEKLEAEIKELNEKQSQAAKSVLNIYEDEEDRKIKVLAAVNKAAADGAPKKKMVRINSQRWTVSPSENAPS